MSKLQNIIKIDISRDTKPQTDFHEYCILVDATVDEVIDCAISYPKAFVFTFDATPVDRIHEMSDYTPLHPVIEEYMDEDGDIMHRFAAGGYKPWMDRLVKCLYIGNFKVEDHVAVIEQFIEASIGKDQTLIYSKGFNQ